MGKILSTDKFQYVMFGDQKGPGLQCFFKKVNIQSIEKNMKSQINAMKKFRGNFEENFLPKFKKLVKKILKEVTDKKSITTETTKEISQTFDILQATKEVVGFLLCDFENNIYTTEKKKCCLHYSKNEDKNCVFMKIVILL